MMLHYLRCCCVESSPGRNIKTQKKKTRRKDGTDELTLTSGMCFFSSTHEELCTFTYLDVSVFGKTAYGVVYAIRTRQDMYLGAEVSGYVF